MTKKKTMKNIKTPNKFNMGGGINPIGGVLSSIGGVAENLISNGFQTKGGAAMSTIGDAVSQIPGAGMIAGPIIKALSGVVNRGFGTKWNQEGLAKAESQITDLNNFQSGASDYNTLAQDFTRIGSMNKTIKASNLGEDGWFVDRTINKANELNTDLGNAYNYAMRNANNVADNIASNTLANLERNYAAFGGPLFAYGGQTHGSDFTNGLMFINNGGTHESNPYEGVPISMDQEGNPNLVEEGEVIWNDYVFSNRLKVPKSIKKKYKLGNREMTFANAVDKLSKESEERPNDPISMRGLEKALLNMALEQENIRSKKEVNSKNNNKFVTGGPAGMYYNDGYDDYYIVSTGDKTAGIQPEVREGYVATPPVSSPESEDTDSSKNLSTLLRYAPVIGSAINVATAFSQKPDYTNADAIINAAKNAATPIKFKPIGDYLTYNPFDTEYHANQLRAVAGATRRNIMNTSGGNRAAAMAGILASDNNTMNQLGDLYRKATEYNLEQKQKVADFNRATNMFNSEGFYKADAQNQQARLSGLDGIIKGHLLREQIDNNLGATRSAALTGLFNNLGNIGKERVALSWLENNPGLSYMLSLNGNGVTFKNPNE